jgi:hypothetical protein
MYDNVCEVNQNIAGWTSATALPCFHLDTRLTRDLWPSVAAELEGHICYSCAIPEPWRVPWPRHPKQNFNCDGLFYLTLQCARIPM